MSEVKRRGPRLFARDELCLRPTGTARLRKLAAGPAPSITARERRRADDLAAMRRLRGWADELCRRFELRYSALEAERDGVNDWYGICYEDGEIRIRLRHARTARLLKESSLCDTLCHELAHLRHLNHGPRFRRLYQRILDTARRLGYYRPGPIDAGARPVQIALFADRCGASRRVKARRG